MIILTHSRVSSLSFSNRGVSLKNAFHPRDFSCSSQSRGESSFGVVFGETCRIQYISFLNLPLLPHALSLYTMEHYLYVHALVLICTLKHYLHVNALGPTQRCLRALTLALTNGSCLRLVVPADLRYITARNRSSYNVMNINARNPYPEKWFVCGIVM